MVLLAAASLASFPVRMRAQMPSASCNNHPEQSLQEEDAFLEDSDFEGISESESEGESGDDDWQPAGSRRRNGGGASGKKRAKKE